jgi:hypothetical protein
VHLLGPENHGRHDDHGIPPSPCVPAVHVYNIQVEHINQQIARGHPAHLQALFQSIVRLAEHNCAVEVVAGQPDASGLPALISFRPL